MPDRRKHRGPHPDDARLFSESQLPALRQAAEDYTLLLTRGYASKSALKLVGDRFALHARQRMALWRTACSDAALAARRAREVPVDACSSQTLAVDGYNALITVESALSGGLILIGRDGCCRDLASMHGTYRSVDETVTALDLIVDRLLERQVARVDWYLDQPVSNSGRLKVLMAERLEQRGVLGRFDIQLVRSPDHALAHHAGVSVTADGPVLDRCGPWTNLVADVLAGVPEAWSIRLY